jgi:hypothetical protein
VHAVKCGLSLGRVLKLRFVRAGTQRILKTQFSYKRMGNDENINENL